MRLVSFFFLLIGLGNSKMGMSLVDSSHGSASSSVVGVLIHY